jgi:hypothetical protein
MNCLFYLNLLKAYYLPHYTKKNQIYKNISLFYFFRLIPKRDIFFLVYIKLKNYLNFMSDLQTDKINFYEDLEMHNITHYIIIF